VIGKTVSHYKIISKLGEGGMGVVYKAEDTRLDRSVALKFLPSSLAAQEAAKQRFIHEAKAASSLEHPNICAVHDIAETDDGQMFIAMPHYQGQTLQERIAEGPMDIGEAIDIVLQLASGLGKAHEQGIVHRDIKPGNIFVTRDGHVKILDFGLAKLATQTRLTKSGTTVGTVAYMSPEQASGDDVDVRSDIFSLGAVLYEMLTGVLPFRGDHEAAVLYGIMNSDPNPLSKYRPDIPEAVQVVMERVLQKDPGDRYQTALEFSDALERAELELGGSSRRRKRSAARATGKRRGIHWRIVLAVGAGAAIVVAAVLLGPDIVERFSSQSAKPLPAPRITPLVASEGFESAPQWSPGGHMIAFEARRNGVWDVWVCDVDGANPLNLTASAQSCERYPAWSPDGGRIAFYSDRDGPGIYTMTVTGGSVRRIVEVGTDLVQESLFYLQWADDNRLIFGDSDATGRDDVYEFDLDDQSLRCLTRTQAEGAHAGILSPSGKFLAFRQPWLGIDVEFSIQNMETGELSKLSLLGGEVCWTPDGENLLVISNVEGSRDLWTVAIDSRSGSQKGEPRRLTSAVSLSAISFSPTGERALGCLASSESSLWVFPTDEGQINALGSGEQITTRASQVGFSQWLSTGTGVVYHSDRRGKRQVWMQELDSKQPVRLSDEASAFPVVSPDGRWVAFEVEEGDGSIGNYVSRPDGGGLHPLYSELPAGLPFIMVSDWSSDGRHVAFHTQVDDDWQLGVAVMQMEEGTASEVRLIGVKGAIPFWSPEGTHLVYQRTEDERPDLYVASIDGEDIYRLTDDPAHEWLAGWSSNPSYVYYGRMAGCGSKEVYRIAMNEMARPTSAPELWMAFTGPIRLQQFMDFHDDRAVGAILEERSDICLIEFETPATP